MGNFLYSHASTRPTVIPPSNIVDFLASDLGKYGNLVEAAAFAGLVDELQEDGYTLFAPSNNLLGARRVPAVNRWNQELTSSLLLNHVISNTRVYNSRRARTTTSASGEKLTFNNRKIGVTDAVPRKALNSELQIDGRTYLVYDIDGVLLPVSQSLNAPQSSTALLEGAAARLGDVLIKYARDDLPGDKDRDFNFYTDALTSLNTAGSDAIYSADLAYTVFLPTEDAFETLVNEVAFKTGTPEYLDDGGLEDALKYHITTGAPKLESTTTYKSLLDTDIGVRGTTVTIDGADATILNTHPVVFENGQAYDIDVVLQFPRQTTVEIATTTPAVSTLALLVGDLGLVPRLDSLTRSTIFAPVDAALLNVATYATWNQFDLPQEKVQKLLFHHVLPFNRVYSTELPQSGPLPVVGADGEEITVEDLGNVVVPDVRATNGNIHVIDTVLVPPSMVGDLPTFDTVVDIAANTEITSTLFELLGQFPDIVALLSTIEIGTSFTVFAPTNDAFAALSADDLAYLTKDDNAKLKEVLEYHVVASGAVVAALQETNEFATALGPDQRLTVEKKDGQVTVNTDSKVIVADVKAYNGVVHVIDKLLIPSTLRLPSVTAA